MLERFSESDGFLTVIRHFALTPSAVARMIALPHFFAVKIPSSSTDTIAEDEDLQRTSWPVETVAESLAVAPFSSVI